MENNPNLEGNLSGKDKAFALAKNGLDKSLARNIVIKTTEVLLPIVFWLGLITIFIISFSTAYSLGSFYSFFERVTTFLGIFLPYSLTLIVSFYLIYLLKDIKDSLQNKGE